jgi:hypothetical protein
MRIILRLPIHSYYFYYEPCFLNRQCEYTYQFAIWPLTGKDSGDILHDTTNPCLVEVGSLVTMIVELHIHIFL